jgi:nucleoside-specific outer membrane channel protein Tsx
MMEIIKSVRTSWVPDALLNSMEHYNAEQQNTIKENGYQFSGKFFSPHFTIVSNDISDEGFKSLSDLLKNKKEEFECNLTGIEFIDRKNNNEPFIRIAL